MAHEHNNEHNHIHCTCSHDHHHEHEHEEEFSVLKIVFAFIFLSLGLAVEHLSFFQVVKDFALEHDVIYPEAIFYLVAFLLCGKSVLIKAVNNILHGQIFDEQFLMSVASIGAIALGEFAEAVAIMLFYNIGEAFQDYAVDKSRSSISSLMDIRSDKAFVIRENKTIEVNPQEVEIDEIIEVKPGQRIPLDGIIIEGQSFLDTSALTGESVERSLKTGEEVLAGFINKTGVLKIKVTKKYNQSAVSRILELTQQASEVKAKSEKFITKFAKVYTPIVCILALIVAFVPPFILSEPLSKWTYRGLMFLVVSCPCALVISIPLTFFSGIGGASKKGILIKGSNFIESLSKTKICVFDKTGTLTKGIFAVSKICPANNFKEDEILAYAAHAEYFSDHPIAKSLRDEHLKQEKNSNCCEKISKSNAQEISGHGIKIQLEDKTVLVGNDKLMAKENINIDKTIQDTGTIVHIAINSIYAGYVVISDQIKEESLSALTNLKKLGIKKTLMLTGDNEESARIISNDLGLDEYYANLLPQDKVSKIEQIIAQNKTGTLLFVGDGINDSPVLARADTGVSMGNLGSDAAIEASDVVIMDDDITKLSTAIKISRKTIKIVKENITFSLGVKAAIMICGALGLSNMWTAVFGDVGVCFLAVLNSFRAMKE